MQSEIQSLISVTVKEWYEANNGIQSGKKSHYQKAIDRVREISRTLIKNLAPGDEEILIKEKNKLEKAIELWEKKNRKK